LWHSDSSLCAVVAAGGKTVRCIFVIVRIQSHQNLPRLRRFAVSDRFPSPYGLG